VTDWIVVLPVKQASRAKSRLGGGAALARAIALDTIEAVAACEAVAKVVVVTDDPELEAFVGGGGVVVMRDRAAAGPDAAIVQAMAELPASAPRAALLGDLPALHPHDLAEALAAAAGVDRGVVADAEGTGSTLVTASAGVAWASAFGADSFARHVALGCTALEVPADSSLRRDVDTPAHLASAGLLGLGRRTTAALRALAAPSGR
jgi:2-phospho-L-lactate guanylyltransferase